MQVGPVSFQYIGTQISPRKYAWKVRRRLSDLDGNLVSHESFFGVGNRSAI
jgi:hypothetical protein